MRKAILILAVTGLVIVATWLPRLGISTSDRAVPTDTPQPLHSEAASGLSDQDRSENEPITNVTEDSALDPQSLEAKRIRASKNAQLNTGLSAGQLQENRKFLFDSFYNPETSNQFYAELHQTLSELYGTEEADFLTSLTVMTDWDEIKQQVTLRRDVTGQNYDDLLLTVGLAHGKITTEEIESIAVTGRELPNNTIHQLARHGRIDSIADLADRGLLVDLNYQDPVTGTNAIGVLVQNIGYFPSEYEPKEAADALRKLIELGIETKPQNGTLDPLDYALMANRSNAHLKLVLTEVLLEQGLPIEESHREQIARMPEGPIKEGFLELFANSL